RAMVIDCDLHQGNGTAKIFAGDDTVFTFSIHQEDLYPVKQQSDLDIPLPDHVQDEEYLGLLDAHLPRVLDAFRPELILYQAGADPYRDDQLGDLSLSIAGLRRRDELVFNLAKARSIPVAVTLGGGYACNTDDTVTIHVNTCLAAMQVWAAP
ncbi:MAG: histone deacetylase, partial [candidate division KSB1 bacterium]|nr:histone deacetylase [candidate division KSB1 bacterium]